MSVGNIHTQPVLSKDPETDGFDLYAGKSWIYPTNLPTREYQFNIIQKALFTNTLVSLPTGLGKTFIAAVVMYNFYRWYPNGKIIFMAPTKPLVKQQVDACYNTMAIPKEATAELTGSKASSVRVDVWQEKRVFFVTPQVLQNDLNTILNLGSKIKCLVFDEAHKARGNHAYCEVIRRLVLQNNKLFRVLALSATPGGNVDDVLEVVQNLLISHLEFRTEESLDVQPYVFHRSLETVVVPLGDKLEEVRDMYLKVLERYTRILKDRKIFTGNCSTLTKGKIFVTLKEFQNKTRGNSSSNYSEIVKSLNICITLYHAYELLTRHGLRSFLAFFDEHIEKPLLRNDYSIRHILEDVRKYLGPIPNIEKLPDGSYPEPPTNIKFGHPKYYKLRDILVSHFCEANEESRVIVFFEYRESVMEAFVLLLQAKPLIRPRIFVGQGAGTTQKTQINVVRDFREGKCNTLLSTCIGEEGLDVGDVDLIVCFDISSKSPIRMVQRMGRTGRKRDGRVKILVTEGKEQHTLNDCLIHKNNISNYVLNSKHLKDGMYTESPRLIPSEIVPQCEKVYITVVKPTKANTIKDMLKAASTASPKLEFSQSLVVGEFCERIPSTVMLFDKSDPLNMPIEKNVYQKYLERQRSLQPIHTVAHSSDTKLLVDLLCMADSKRFNIPTTQIQGEKKQFKQTDIRNMLFSSSSQKDFVQSSVNEDKYVENVALHVNTNEPEFDHNNAFMNGFLKILSTYLPQTLSENRCRLCRDNPCPNKAFSYDRPLYSNNKWIPLDSCVYENITDADFEHFERTFNLSSKCEDVEEKLSEKYSISPKNNTDVEYCDDLNLIQHSTKHIEEENCSFKDFENISFSSNYAEFNSSQQYNFDEFKDNKSIFEAPRNLSVMLDKTNIPVFIISENSKSQTENCELKITCEELCAFFKLQSLDDLFETQDQQVINNVEMFDDDLGSMFDTSCFGVLPDAPTTTESIMKENTSPIINKKRYEKIKLRTQLKTTKLNDELVTDIPIECERLTPEILTQKFKTLDETLCTNYANEFSFNLPCTPKKSTNVGEHSNNHISQSDISITQMLSILDKNETNINNTVNQNEKINKLENYSTESDEKEYNKEIRLDSRRYSHEGTSKFDLSESFSFEKSFKDKKSIYQTVRNQTEEFCRPSSPRLSKKKRKNPFIMEEAELSDEDHIVISDDEEESGLDHYDASFVCDKTQYINTQVHANYLQSIRSPIQRGNFKIPYPVKNCATSSFIEDDDYMEDSFVVNIDDEKLTQDHDLSELEILERELSRKKRKKKNEIKSSAPKRRRVIVLSDDSD